MTSIKEAIYLLINLEKTLGDKCDLLTAIGITATNDDTFKNCEEVRNEIVQDFEEMEKVGSKLVRSGNPGEEDSNSDGIQETDRAFFDALSEL